MQKSLVGTVAKTKVYFVQSFDGFGPVCVWDGTNLENVGQYAPLNAFPHRKRSTLQFRGKGFPRAAPRAQVDRSCVKIFKVAKVRDRPKYGTLPYLAHFS